uniref:Fibronectin type-III domain-containing protein n=1 Tax=Heterorhabditis bacteriophora TaxID=37862 RepID=A0A1I7XRY1_HETBA
MAVEVDDDSRRVERARVSPHLNSHVLSGLRPNTKYLIGVVAIVDHEPQQVVRTSVIESTLIRFEWQKPSCDESVAPIDGYEYLIHEASQPAPPDGASYIGGTAVTVADLRPDTQYSFHVRSRSGNGHSQWSQYIHIKTEAAGETNDVNCLTNTNTITRRRVRRQKAHLIRGKYRLACGSSTNKGEACYNLRIVLAPHKSYLVWTPLTEHANHIAFFKLAYKERKSVWWTQVVGSPAQFRCPDRISDLLDYCYELRNFISGAHYISSISYNLTNGKNSPNGNPLHFSLIQLAAVSQSSHAQISISQPRIEQQGSRSVAYWTTSGDTSQLYGYHIDIRRDNEREWREQSQIIHSEPTQSHYRHSLGNLAVASTYFLRVNRWYRLYKIIVNILTCINMYCSPKIIILYGLLYFCLAPLSPENVRLDRVSENSVRASWDAPQYDSSCQTYFFITGTQNGSPINHRVPGNEYSYDIQGQAQGDWRVEVGQHFKNKTKNRFIQQI